MRSAPFQRTTELEMKFVPVTVRVNAAPPAVTLDGEIAAMEGTGLSLLDDDEEPPQLARASASSETHASVPATRAWASECGRILWCPFTTSRVDSLPAGCNAVHPSPLPGEDRALSYGPSSQASYLGGVPFKMMSVPVDRFSPALTSTGDWASQASLADSASFKSSVVQVPGMRN